MSARWRIGGHAGCVAQLAPQVGEPRRTNIVVIGRDEFVEPTPLRRR